MDPITRAMEGAAGASLTTGQRRQMMAHLVRPAWRVHFARFPGQTPEDFDAWRGEENFKACGKTSLRACTQADWPALMSHYLRIMGRRAAAERMDQRRLTGARAVAMDKLRRACECARDVIARPFDYVGVIASSRFKRPIEELGARELWVLTFDLRRAAQRRRRPARAGGAA